MGNCLRSQRTSSMRWDGEDWSLFDEMGGGQEAAAAAAVQEGFMEEKDKMAAAPSTEVKIKISKKQLEELLGRADVQGMSVEQILLQLMNTVNGGFELRHRHWRPALQSIPEAD